MLKLLLLGAYLLEEKDDTPTVFSASIGNLPPGKAVLLTITYVVELDFDDGKLMYVVCLLCRAPSALALCYLSYFIVGRCTCKWKTFSYRLPTQPYAPNGRDPSPKFTKPSAKDFTEEIPYGLQVIINVRTSWQVFLSELISFSVQNDLKY